MCWVHACSYRAVGSVQCLLEKLERIFIFGWIFLLIKISCVLKTNRNVLSPLLSALGPHPCDASCLSSSAPSSAASPCTSHKHTSSDWPTHRRMSRDFVTHISADKMHWKIKWLTCLDKVSWSTLTESPICFILKMASSVLHLNEFCGRIRTLQVCNVCNS